VYDHSCHMNGIYLVYTRYIPGIRQEGIFQVYTTGRYIPVMYFFKEKE
jgi:hypothetical protein